MFKERSQNIFIRRVWLFANVGKNKIAQCGSHRDEQYTDKLGAFRNAFIAMHFVPVVNQADYHIARGSAQADQQKRPLPGIQLEYEARANAGGDNRQSKCRATYQGEFDGLDFRSFRVGLDIGAIGAWFEFAAAEPGE